MASNCVRKILTQGVLGKISSLKGLSSIEQAQGRGGVTITRGIYNFLDMKLCTWGCGSLVVSIGLWSDS